MSLNPLKYEVSIKGDALDKLQQIQKAFDKIKDTTTIKLNLEGFNMSEIETFAKAVNAMKTSLNQAFKTLKDDDFSKFSENINKCREAVEGLDNAFKNLNNTASSEIKSLISGLGATIQSIQTTMNAAQGIKMGMTPQQTDAYVKGIEDVGKASEKTAKQMSDAELKRAKAVNDIQRYYTDLENRMNRALSVGVDDSKLERYRNFLGLLSEFKEKMGSLSTNDALSLNMKTQFDQIYSRFQSEYKELQGLIVDQNKLNTRQRQEQRQLERDQRRAEKEAESEARKLAISVNTAAVAYERLSVAQRNVQQKVSTGEIAGQDVEKARNFINHLERIKQLMIEIQTNHGYTPANALVPQGLFAGEALRNIGTQKEMIWGKAYTGDLSKELRDAEANMRRADAEANKLYVTISNLESLSGKGKALGIDTTQIDAVINQLKQLEQEFRNVAQTNSGSAKAMMLEEPFLAAKRNVQTATKQIKSDINEALKPDQSVSKAYKEFASIVRQISSLTKTEKRANALGIDTSTLRTQINLLERYRSQLEAIVNNSGKGIGVFLRDTGYLDARTNPVTEQARLNAEIAQKKEQNANATMHLTQQEKHLSQEMKKTTQSGWLQNQMLQDLKSMAMQYLGVWGAASFVKNMTQITGELELQQKSIEIIIGNAQMAGQLFSDIRDLSQQSPYTFQDLLKSERQLAAFGIQTKDLYATMKSLSDIGAGLSVDVQRLILAYGHTRSYGYLSGIQNRQFETAGIDMIGALTDRYNKLADAEERAGRAAEHVTRKDIFKMMRTRDISFEDVNAVIMDLDKPGGRFYNMQERQFETLGGKLRNLRNNYNIMMSEMGEDTKGVLMGSVNMLNNLMENWSRYASVIKSVLIPLAGYRLATLALNGALGAQATQMSKNVMAFGKSAKAMEAFNAVSFRGGIRSFINSFTGGWKSQGSFVDRATSLQFNNVLSKGLNDGSLTTAQVRMMSLSKDLPYRLRAVAAAASGLKGAEVEAAAGAQGLNRQLQLMKLRLSTAGAGLRAFGAAIVSSIPMVAIMAAFTGITALVSHFRDMAKETKRALDEMADAAKNDEKEISSLIDKYESRGVVRTAQSTYINGQEVKMNILDFNTEYLSGEKLIQDIEDLKIKLQAMSPLYDGDVIDIMKADSQVEQFKEIMKKLESYRRAADISGAIAGDFDKSAGGSFWGGYESLQENMKDFARATERISKGINKLSEEQMNSIDEQLGGELSSMVEKNVAYDKTEALRQVFVRVLFMDDETRKAVYDSWSKEIKTLFNNIMNVTPDEYGNLGSRPFSKSIISHLDSLKDNFKRTAEGLRPYVKNLIDQDDMDAAIKLVDTFYNKMKEETKNLKDSELLQKDFLGIVIGEDMANTYLANAQFKDEFTKAFNDRNLKTANREEIASASDEIIEEIYQKWLDANKDFYLVSEKTIEDVKKAALNMTDFGSLWQQRLRDEEAFYNKFTKEIREGESLSQFFGEDMKKKHDELAKIVEDSFPNLRKEWGIEIEPDFRIQTSNLTQEKSLRDAILSELSETTDEYKRETLNSVLKSLEQSIILQETALKYGYSYDPKGSGNNGRGSRSKTDRWDERIRIMKEAYDWYDKWEKKVGDGRAIDEVSAKYHDIFEEWRNDKDMPFAFDAKDVKSYITYIEQIRDQAEALYKKQRNSDKDNYGQEALRVYRQAVAVLSEYKFDNFTKASEKFASDIERVLSDLDRAFDIYNSVRENTGDEGLARRLSGIEYGATVADLRRAAVSEMAEGRAIDFKSVAGMSDKEIDEYVETLGVAETKIEGIQKGLKSWKKAQDDIIKSDIQNYAKWLGSLSDIATVMTKNENEYNKAMEETSRLLSSGNITPEQAFDRRVAAGRVLQSKNWEASSGYYNLYNNAQGLAAAEIERLYDRESENLLNKLYSRQIGLKEFSDGMDKLNNILSEFNKNSFLGVGGGVGAFLTGGSQGLVSYYRERAAALRGEGKIDEAKEADKAAEKLENLQNAADNVSKAFNDIASAANLLGDMFEALGMEGEANGLHDAGSLLSGITGGAQSLSAFGPWGMAAGAVIGGITAAAKLHDEHNQRLIDTLQDNVNALQMNTDAILRARERTLGYDMGDTRRAMAVMYNETSKSAAMKAMQEYYKNNSGGNGYSQQYKNLIEQRKEYIAMYDEEADKKNSSQDALDEYTEKIAELDDQIANFTEDIARDLWGIDIKGWADQINDALMTALENGEDAMKAFNDTVKSIMQSVVSEIIKIGIVEPMMRELQYNLFGKVGSDGNRHGGIISYEDLKNDPNGAAMKIVNYMGEYMKPGGSMSNMVTAAQEVYVGIDDFLKQHGWANGLGSNDTNTLSNTIQGTSEETSDLLAGYLNTLRQDVAIERLHIEHFIAESWPEYIESFAHQVTVIERLDSNVALIAQMIQKGEGAMYEQLSSIRTRVDNFALGIDAVTVR